MAKKSAEYKLDNLQEAYSAVMGLPTTKEEWEKQIFAPLEAIDREKKALAEEHKECMSDIKERHKLTQNEIATANKLMKMSTGGRAAWLSRIYWFLKFKGYDIPLEFVEKYKPGEGINDDGPIFDRTASAAASSGPVVVASTNAAEGKSVDGHQSPPAETGALALDDAQKRFEANAHKAPNYAPTEEEIAAKHAAIEQQRKADEAVFADVDKPKAENVVPIKRKPGRPKKVKVDDPAPVQLPQEAATSAVADRADKYLADQKKRLGDVPEVPKVTPPAPPPVAAQEDDGLTILDDVQTTVADDKDDDLSIPDFLKRTTTTKTGAQLFEGANPTWENTMVVSE